MLEQLSLSMPSRMVEGTSAQNSELGRSFSVLLESFAFAYNLFVQLLSIGTEAGSARVDEIKYCLLIVSVGMLVKICLYVDLLLFL